MKRIILIIIAMAKCAIAICQQQNYNKQWVQGEGVTFKTTFTATGPVNQFWDSLPPAHCFSYGCSCVCNVAGEVVLATNNLGIFDANGVMIDGGDSLISNLLYASWNCSYGTQANIILPLPDSIYYVFSATYSDSLAAVMQVETMPDILQYHCVDMKLNNYAGKVVKRKRVAVDNVNLAASNMTAVRHANGRDWWLVKLGAKGLNGHSTKFYKFLVMKDTVLGPFIQTFPNTADGTYIGSWTGQSCFNNSGTKHALVDGWGYLLVLDFERCSGQLSNPVRYNVPAGPTGENSTAGVCFSPNDSLLYIACGNDLEQLEINNLDSSTAWSVIGAPDTTSSLFPGYLSLLLAHDQKIYIGRYGNTMSTMSVVNNPNAKGAAADFCPQCMRFPKYQGTQGIGVSQPPNMPNFVLGATGSPCNTDTINYPTDTTTITTILQKTGSIKLYPNPAATSITIEASTPGTLTLTDMLGRQQLSIMIGKGKQTLSVAQLPAGMYVYQYKTREGAAQHGKLLIVKE